MKTYEYVGPADIRARAVGKETGAAIASKHDLEIWLDTAEREATTRTITATFVVRLDGRLLLAGRRSEHVACAGGAPVPSAGEMTFTVDGPLEISEITNQSTGYCPEPESWPAVEAALKPIGVEHPPGFTTAITFRRCESCHQINVVKDGWYVCSVCGRQLPPEWNSGSSRLNNRTPA